MAEYIDKEQLLDFIQMIPIDLGYREIEDVKQFVKEIPAADVVERKTGKWINYLEDGFVECPFCKSATNCDGDIAELHYCFNCGAKLEGDDDV